MTAPIFSNWPFTKWFAAGLLFAASAVEARSDEFYDLKDTSIYVDNTDHDLQFFSPVDFGFNNQPLRKDCGYFFNYNKLSWAFTGERTTLGDPGRTVLSEIIYRQNPQDQGAPPAPYVIQNGIQNSPPRAEFAWGERYEFGVMKDGTEWLIGIIDGPESKSQAVFGFGPGSGLLQTNNPSTTNTPGIDGYYLNPEGGWDDNGDGIPDGDGPTDPILALGFGSVHVNFDASPGFFVGFRNYLINELGPGNGTVTGPTLWVGNTGTFGDTLPDDVEVELGAIGVTDDIDGDLNPGFGYVVDPDGNILLFFVDFDDLHEFNVAFDRVTVRNSARTDGIELMKSHKIDNSHLQVKNQNHQLEFGYGVRYLRLQDSFNFLGEGSILGMTTVDQEIENNIVGPQVRLRWNNQQGRVLWSLDGRCLFGYNVSNWDQVGLFGQELVPGGINRPLYAQPTASAYGRQDNDFSPVAELRAQAAYQLSGALAVKLGYTAIYADNIHRAANAVRWHAPDWGMNAPNSTGILINGVDFGFEVVY